VYVAPTSDIERTIAGIWQHALGIEEVGIYDNFFELGGDSVVAIQVISQLKHQLQADISVVAMYEQMTIRSLAELLDTAQKNTSAMDKFAEEQNERVTRRKQYQRQQRLKRER
jgi:acyl carrier protein